MVKKLSLQINIHTYINGFILSRIYRVAKSLISLREINIVNIRTATITFDYYKYFLKKLISNIEVDILEENQYYY